MVGGTESPEIDGRAHGGGMTRGTFDKRGIPRSSRYNGTLLEALCIKHTVGDT